MQLLSSKGTGLAPLAAVCLLLSFPPRVASLALPAWLPFALEDSNGILEGWLPLFPLAGAASDACSPCGWAVSPLPGMSAAATAAVAEYGPHIPVGATGAASPASLNRVAPGPCAESCCTALSVAAPGTAVEASSGEWKTPWAVLLQSCAWEAPLLRQPC